MNTIAVPRITPGMTLAVEQADYCYGTGMALLVVRSIAVDPQMLPMLEWVLLHCVRLRHDGSVVGAFSPLVRTRALAAAVRPTGWLPSIVGPHATASSDSMIDRACTWPTTQECDRNRTDEGHQHG